jgi:hypothetical protein
LNIYSSLSFTSLAFTIWRTYCPDNIAATTVNQHDLRWNNKGLVILKVNNWRGALSASGFSGAPSIGLVRAQFCHISLCFRRVCCMAKDKKQ